MKPLHFHLLLAFAFPFFTEANEPEVHIFKTIDGIPPLEIHAFHPEIQEDKHSAIIWLYGSAFERRPSLPKAYPYCRALSERGMVSFAADIRGIEQSDDPEVGILLCLTDVLSAYQWVYENADELNIDRNRIAIAGFSSGATLAIMLSTYTEYLSPEDYPEIPVNPSVQVLLAPITSAKLMKERFAPINHLKPGTPPSVIFHGTLDLIEPISKIREYRSAMESAGNECQLYTYKGKRHSFHHYRNGDNPTHFKVLEGIFAFLEEHGQLASK